MKWAVYSLLLINLAFGLWHFRGQDRASQVETDDDALRLVLLKEYLAQSSEKNSSTATSSASGKDSCYTLGPFMSHEDAAVIRKKMLSVGIDAKRRLDRDNKRKGYWVFLPPASTRKAAKQKIREIKEKGIKDYFLVVAGDYPNAISLGVFSRSESAQRRYQDVKKLGFTSRVLEVDLPVREYWLDWPKEQQLLPDVLARFKTDFAGIGQAERSCSE